MMTLPPLPIIRAGHPTLRRIAAPIEDPGTEAIATLAARMSVTMTAAGGVGLAAPQVAAPLRLIMFWVPETRASNTAHDLPQDLTILINPAFTPLSGQIEQDWEGCLSIPGLRGLVPRYHEIGYRGLGLDGALIERVATGFHARVVQHEIDHLNGVLYPSRMTDMGTLGFNEEILAAQVAEPGEETLHHGENDREPS